MNVNAAMIRNAIGTKPNQDVASFGKRIPGVDLDYGWVSTQSGQL